ncbi:MAG: AraC family transcriptional regulator [Ignavibacteriae bacterium]|nr:MAG: AraC family transcriptional regulator [Ignavibacteriota bacterium]
MRSVSSKEQNNFFPFYNELNTMNVGFLDIINFIALFQLAVFIIFLAFKRTNRQSNRILAIFLFEQIVMILGYEFTQFYLHINAFCPDLFFISVPMYFLAGPTFYFYVKSLAYSDFQLKKRHLLNALPALFIALYFIGTFHIHSMESKQAMILNNSTPFAPYWIYYNIAVHCHILSYNIASLLILKNYRSKLRQEYSSIQNINLSWVSVVLYGFLMAWCTSAFSFLSTALELHLPVNLALIDFLAFFIFFNYIFFKALIHPTIFSGVEEDSRQKAPNLSKSVEEKYLNMLSRYMETEKPYLDPNITLIDLSKKVLIPHRSLSEIINNTLGLNYYDFINKYRIEESQRLLSDHSAEGKTILEILYEVGFNTKSSFNQAFKKHTGTTPTEFKRQRFMAN